MAVTNQGLNDRLESDGWSVEKLDTAPVVSGNSLFARSTRVPAMLRSWLRLVRRARGPSIPYVSLSGGWGQLYDLVTLALGWALGMRCAIHHHSMHYLRRRRWPAWVLFVVSGTDTVHIALCQVMGQRLATLYACQRVVVLSNAALFSVDSASTRARFPKAVGMLSNLTPAKGGWDILDLARSMRATHQECFRTLAGIGRDG